MKRTGMTLVFCAIVLSIVIVFFVRDTDAEMLSDEQIKEIVTSQYPGKITELSFDSQTAAYKVKMEKDEQLYEVIVDSETGEIESIEKKAGKKLTIKEKELVKEEQTKDDEQLKEEAASEEKQQPSQEKEKQTTESKPQQQEKEQVKQVAESKPKSQPKEEKPAKQTAEPKPQPKQTEQKEAPKQEKKTEKKKAIISQAEAKQIALREFSGTVTEVELDDDDGRLLYEVEIEKNEDEATIEIDAYTGKIIMVEIDRED